MSSLPSGASQTAIDTRLPGSTSFLNASSTANGAPNISPVPSSSLIPSGLAPEDLTSSKDVLDVPPNTTQSSPAQATSSRGSSISAEETVDSSPTTVAQDRSSTASDEPALPTTTGDSSQAASSAPAQTPSSTKEPSPQIVTLATVSTSKTATATPPKQTPPSITIPSQSSAVGSEIAQEISPTPARPTSITPSQVTSAATQPTDDSTQDAQVLSAESVDFPAETPAPPSVPAAAPAEVPSSTVATSSVASTAAGNSPLTQGQQPIVPTGAVNHAVSISAASSSSTTSTSTPSLALISSSASVSTSAPGSAAILAAPSATTSTPVSVTSVPLSDSILSAISSNTVTDAVSTTSNFTEGITTFPTAISTSSGDVPESSLPAGSQPTGQPIEDPVGSSSKPSTGTIVGGTVGGVAAVALIIILLWLWKKRAADERSGPSKAGGFTEKGSFQAMAQKLGVSTTLSAVRQNIGEKLGSRNVNMDRGNSQFLEAAIAEPSNATLPPDPLCQHPVTPGNNSREFRKGQGISLQPGKLNPFSDANSFTSGTRPPSSRSSILNPFSDDSMVLPAPVSASTRRSRGRSLGGLGSFQVLRGPPRPHSVHRESLQGLDSINQNRQSFLQRRDKFRSDPFDLELQSNQLFPPGTAISTRASSVYSGNLQQNSHDSYTSRYVVSGSSLGDWGGVKEEPVAYDGLVERVDSPTIG